MGKKRDIELSVIIPFYYGNKYMKKLIPMLIKAFKNANILDNSEIIIINDSPDESPIVDSDLVKVITNENNMGIHYSRALGVANSHGRYIHFFDQDDEITTSFYKSQLKSIENNDVVVCNAIIEHDDYNRIVYRSRLWHKLINQQWAYSFLGNRITSPGQCIIKKNSIPAYWLDAIMKTNGADDLLLWLCMLKEKRSFCDNPKVLYKHKLTDANTSKDDLKMLDSTKEVSDLLEEKYGKDMYSKFLKKNIEYKKAGKLSVYTILPFLIDLIRKQSIRIRG